MDKKVKKLIYDMLQAVNRIEDFVDPDRIFEKYTADRMLQQAVERNQ